MFKRKAEGEAEAKMENGAAANRKAVFARNLAALNSQFATWVAEQSSAAPRELWTDGVGDYLQYARQLLEDYKDVVEVPASQPSDKPADPPAGGLFGFAGGASAIGSSKPPLAPVGGLFGGGGGGSTAPTAPGSIFGALPSTGGAFGLGSSATVFGGFGGSATASAANSGSLFNVPSTGTLGSLSTGAAAAGADADGEEEEEEEEAAEPSVQVEAGEGTELLLKEPAKLSSMTIDANGGKKWTDKGFGTLTLRRATGEQAAARPPYFVFTTGSGRILLNAPLLKNMKFMHPPKQRAALIMYLISVVDGKEERAMQMFKLDSAEAAKKLVATVTELQG